MYGKKRPLAIFPKDRFFHSPIFMRYYQNMAEEEGFEPPRGLTRLSVFKTDPFSQTWVLLHHDQKYIIMAKIKSQCSHNRQQPTT